MGEHKKTSHLYAVVEDATRQAFGESKSIAIPCDPIGGRNNFAITPAGTDKPLVQPANITDKITLNLTVNIDGKGERPTANRRENDQYLCTFRHEETRKLTSARLSSKLRR
ncbi:MAG: hypothetical protein AB8B94_07630 [Hyphomicrobiales bacterium]